MDGVIGKALIVSFFFPCFVIGVGGNVWVVVMLRRAWPKHTAYAQMSLYILLLSVADLCVLLMTPVVMSYFLLNNFIFGAIGCKLYFAIENINKLLSVAILVLMSLERFLVVCRPVESGCCRANRRPVVNVFLIVLTLFLVIVVLCFPIIYYAGITEMVDFRPDGSVTHLATLCISSLPDQIMTVFIGYMFVLGYLMPASIILVCYFFLIRHLRNTERWITSMTRQTNRVQSVVRSVLSVILFHFLCWTPFWCFVLLPMISYYRLFNIDFIIRSQPFQTARMVSSFLPYLNSAGNWIFYSKTITYARPQANGQRSRQSKPTFHEQLRRSIFASWGR